MGLSFPDIRTINLMLLSQAIHSVADNKKMEIYEFPGGYAREYDDIDPFGGERSMCRMFFDEQAKNG